MKVTLAGKLYCKMLFIEIAALHFSLDSLGAIPNTAHLTRGKLEFMYLIASSIVSATSLHDLLLLPWFLMLFEPALITIFCVFLEIAPFSSRQ